MKAVLSKENYEIVYLDLREIITEKLKSRLPFRIIIRQEIEKRYPFLDFQSRISFHLYYSNKKIYLASVIIENGLSNLKTGAGYIEMGNKKVKIFSYKKRVFSASIALICVFLGCAVLVNNNEIEETGNSSETNESIYPVSDMIREPLQMENLFLALSSLVKDKTCVFDYLSLRADEDNQNIVCSIRFKGLFPEELMSSFSGEDRNRIKITDVSYNNNVPLLNAEIQADYTGVYRNDNKVLEMMREIIISTGGLMLYESTNEQTLRARIKGSLLNNFLQSAAEKNSLMNMSSISFTKNDDASDIELVFGDIGFLPFSYPSLLELFKKIQVDKKNQETKKKPDEIKKPDNEKILFGKVLLEDGTTRVFYKNKEGKMESEVIQ